MPQTFWTTIFKYLWKTFWRTWREHKQLKETVQLLAEYWQCSPWNINRLEITNFYIWLTAPVNPYIHYLHRGMTGCQSYTGDYYVVLVSTTPLVSGWESSKFCRTFTRITATVGALLRSSVGILRNYQICILVHDA